MSKSPPIDIKGNNPETDSQAQLAYVAELFKGTMLARPFATLQVMGSSGYYLSLIEQGFVKLQIPRQKIELLVLTNTTALPGIGFQSLPPNWNLQNSASIVIDYGENKTGKQKFTVAFKPDDKSPIEVEFEVAPDGSMLTEVKAEWSTPLKIAISDAARMGYRQVKFATKIVGIAGFDRKTVNNIETELKGKLKQTLSFYLRTQGHEYVKIQFYGAIGVKYSDSNPDEKYKMIKEGGFLFEVPFDLADVLK
jgi:hypothetical protein